MRNAVEGDIGERPAHLQKVLRLVVLIHGYLERFPQIDEVSSYQPKEPI
jgi:hypothetical protein